MEARVSVPMSPLPSPPPAEPAADHPHRRRTDTLSGWVPADDDESFEATSWRARKALARTTRQDASITALTTSMDRLESTIARVGVLVKWIGGPAVLAVVVDLVRAAVHWLLTLHH